MMHWNARRDGFALMSAIAALVLIGVLVTGGFVAATHEGAISESTRYTTEAFNAAERGLNEVIGTWQLDDYDHAAARSPVRRNLCRDGSIVAEGTACPQGDPVGHYAVEVSQLGASGKLFLLRSEGEVVRHGRLHRPHHTLARVVRTNTLSIAMDRAVSVSGKIQLGNNVTISGRDAIPPDYSNAATCDAPNPDLQAGVMAADTTKVTFQNDKKISDVVTGAPRIGKDPALAAGSAMKFGDMTYEQLVALATITVDGSKVHKTAPTLDAKTGACDYRDFTNWGAPRDPTHKCKDYFPIIHVTGAELALNGGGEGQGILLVDGDFKPNGGYTFYGIVIVKGNLIGGNGGTQLFGTTYVMGETQLDGSALQGNPVVNLSTCAINDAIRRNTAFAFGTPIAFRSWFDLSAIGSGI